MTLSDFYQVATFVLLMVTAIKLDSLSKRVKQLERENQS